MSEHVLSSKMYYGIWIALMILTVVTARVAFIDLGPFNTVVALVIATCKALLVVLFFMHVLHSKSLIWVIALSGLFWLGILMILTLTDYATRSWLAY